MTELKEEQGRARSGLGRAFLRRRNLALPSLTAHTIFWPVTAAGLTLDLASKRAVFEWLQQRQYNSISIINGFLRLVMAENNGAAFGIAAGQHRLLAAVSVIALIVILVLFLFSRIEQKLVHIALGLFAAGVCGNLYDRIFNNGLVRDFIDVVYWPGRHWPAFNIADCMLCIAVALLIISSFFTPPLGGAGFTGRSSRKRARRHK